MTSKDYNQLCESARQTNLIDYFRESGYQLNQHGSEYYVKEFPGLTVNGRTNQWYRHGYGNVGGNNAVDCLVKVCGLDFKQAVYQLTGQDLTGASPKEFPKDCAPQFTSPRKTELPLAKQTELKMPEQDANMRRLFAYFCQARKIPGDIVSGLAHERLMYQSRAEISTMVNGVPQKSNTHNAVFVHKNANGEVIGGEVQGLCSYKRYKGIVAGTADSAFKFTPMPRPDGQIKSAYLFESAIDLMSFYAFCKQDKMQGVMLVSMAGLKPNVGKELEAQGIKVYSCVDNDDAGRKFESDNGFKRLTDMLEQAGVKDWNELLIAKQENPEKVKSFVPDIEKKTLFGGRKKR